MRLTQGWVTTKGMRAGQKPGKASRNEQDMLTLEDARDLARPRVRQVSAS